MADKITLYELFSDASAENADRALTSLGFAHPRHRMTMVYESDDFSLMINSEKSGDSFKDYKRAMSADPTYIDEAQVRIITDPNLNERADVFGDALLESLLTESKKVGERLIAQGFRAHLCKVETMVSDVSAETLRMLTVPIQ